jgi:hypothetical protein
VSTQPNPWALIVLCCAATIAAAQQAGPSTTAPDVKSTPQSEAGEPRADTSSPSAASPNPSGSTPAAGAAASSATASPPAPASATVGKAPAPARPVTTGASAGHPSPAAATAQKSATKADRLDLGTATVTGDREQPKVMYIVPWKRSDIGDLAGRPMNSLVDEILAPVDRDVFKREVVYYQAVQADASQNGAQPKAAPQGEK